MHTFRSIKGNDLDNVLFGDGIAKVLEGFGGDDVLVGYGYWGGGDYTFFLDSAPYVVNEKFKGGRGNDSIYGGYGDDTLMGGAGDDLLRGGGGADKFEPGTGNDVIVDFSPHDVKALPVVANFDGLSYGGFQRYEGMYWEGFGSLPNPSFYAIPGMFTVSRGGGVAYIDGKNGAFFQDVQSNFDLSSGYFAANYFSPNPTSAEVVAYDRGKVVGTATFDTHVDVRSYIDFAHQTFTGSTTVAFTGRFTDIDKIEFLTTGTGISMDDLSLVVHGEGDTIKVRRGEVAAVVASATADGHGGTLLTHSGGTVDLVGIDPEAVNASWFSR